MKSWKIFSLFLLFPLLGFSGSEQATKDRMKKDLDIIQNIFDVHYAPKEWKNLYSGWVLEEEIEKAKVKIDETSPITTKAYQRIVQEFFNSTKDYHVTVRFWSTESAKLPFSVKQSEGKYFITYVDEEKLSPLFYKYKKGDEVVSFDGRPTDEVIQELMETEFRYANKATDQALAEIYLTSRLGALGHKVPRGPVKVGIKSKLTGKVQNTQLIWNYTPEKITHGMNPKPSKKRVQQDLNTSLNDLLNDEMLAPQADVMEELAIYLKDSKDLLGSKESFIPELGKIWWSSDPEDTFHAYIYENENRELIGYVRIPHYKGGLTGEVEAFEEIIKRFEERTDAIVIDQINNPGGSVYYCYALASLLTEEPLFTPKHRMMITQFEVGLSLLLLTQLENVTNDEEAIKAFGSTFFSGIPVTHQFVQFIINYCHFIIAEWDAGRRLTEPHYILGVDHINPHPTTRYTKPILFLINQLDFSCGDFVPAILQDNKRVTLLGTRTAGAGGYIRNHTFPNNFGLVYFTYTASIAERLDKNPIENLGVTPDIEYEITPEDIQGNYKGYAAAINKAVSAMLHKEESSQESKEIVRSEIEPLLITPE